MWCQDEHRIGLKPILRRVWSPKGQRPSVIVQPRYQWTYLYGFVHPASGRTFWLLLPSVSVDLFQLALDAFARMVRAGQGKQILLVLDRAGWHASAQLHIPIGVHLLFLPPYSPELQPAEHLWPLTNEAIANRPFHTLDELEEQQVKRCVALQSMTGPVRAHTCLHWWPSSA